MTPEQIKAIQERFAKVEALLWTLQQGLSASWTPELAAAWAAAYGVLSEYMIAEASGRSAAAERAAS